MSTFSIQIDATQLVYRDFIIPGKTDWISSRTIQTLTLEPGGYQFQIGSGYLADFTFSVTPAGTVDYDASFDAFLSGRGSTTLTIAGFPVTLDARNLSGAGVLLVIPATNEDWISYKTCRMVPASYYSVQQGSGEVTSFNFKLGLDGTFSYDPSYDISRGGFLAGSGTSTLKFLGYPILVDARAAGGTSLTILPIWGMPSSPTSVQLATLLPAPIFVLYISGAATKAVFSLDVHGNFSFDNSLSPYLELQTFQGLPIIDPDVIGPPDFRQPVAGQAPYELWQQRRSWVDSSLATLKSDREAHDLTFILKEVLGDPLPDLATLKDNLEKGVDIDKTLSQIKALHFTVDSFLRLMTIKAQDDAKQPVQETEWEEIYAILTQVMKVGQFTTWRAEELAKGIILGPQDFWIALKEPQLTRWLATAQDRSAWQQALIARSQPPIIDPDLIGPGDMNNPGGDPAYHLWRDRSAWVDMQLSALQASPQTADGLDAIIQSTLGVPATDLVALATERDKGTNISAQLAQLTLSNEAFVTLLRMRDLVASGVPVLDSEWSDIYSILVQVQKQRSFAVWRQEEHDQHIVLGPDLFQIQAPPPADSPPAPSLPAWRATQEARNNWQDTLQSRIDQEQTVISGMQEAVSSIEQETLSLLRSALILASDAPGKDLPSKSRWLTDQLVIDTEASSCELTTRVAQAIATIQDILFSIRTGEFKQDFIEPGSQLAALSTTSSFFDVFVQGTDNGLDVIEFNNGQASLSSFGGTWTSGPAVTIDRASGGLSPEMHFLIRGTDQAIWHQWFDGDQWYDWESLGGVWTSSPAAAFWRTGSTRHLDVFARGTDNSLWHKWFDGSWHDWESLGGTLTSGPAAASWGTGHLDVFARGSYDILLHRAFDNNQWGNWESLGGALASAPSAVSWASNRIDVFAQGSDDTLQHLWFDGSWHDWESLGGTLTSGPVVSSWDVGQLDVFVQGSDNTLQHKQFDGSWHDWETLPLPPSLTLDAPNFEEEWKWIGSYATWRSAMSVFLYPENILLPSLRRQKTPAFNSLIDDLRANPNLTVKQARQEAAMYSKYFEDVCNLTVEASCLALTPSVTKGTVDQSLLYLFARAKDGTIYWSAYNRADDPSYDQTFWDTVPGINYAVQIIGAVPYLPNNDQHQILLFVKTNEKGSDRLLFTTYDLLRQAWSGSLTELKLPQDADVFSALVEQHDDVKRPPNLVILTGGIAGDKLYTRLINHAGLDWESTDFRPLTLNDSQGQPINDVQKILSLSLPPAGGNGTFFFQTSTAIFVASVFVNEEQPHSDPFISDLLPPSSLGSGTWIGGLDVPPAQPARGSISVAYVLSDAGAVTYGFIVQFDIGQGPIKLDKTSSLEMRSIAVHSGYDPALPGTGKLLAFQLQSGAQRAIFTVLGSPEGGAVDVQVSEVVSIAPNAVVGPFDITEQLSESDIQTRRTAIKNAFNAVFADPASQCINVVYLEEAYYFVPVQLALQLEGRGEYITALAWFRTVYDYSVPPALRKIYYGLKLEESMSSLPQCNQDSLLDPLNPHTIAATRVNTYTRYTLMSIIRCLVDFADAEFTRDTAESVPRADILYTTALGLFDTPELKQNPTACQQLINALRVQIDDPRWVSVWRSLQQDLASIADLSVLTATIGRVKDALAANGSWALRLAQASAIIAQAKGSLPVSPTLGTVIQEDASRLARAQTALLRAPTLFEASQQIGTTVGTGLLQAISNITKVPMEKLEQEGIALPALHNHTLIIPQNSIPAAPLSPASPGTNALPDPATVLSSSIVDLMNNYANGYFASPPSSFCVPANQVLAALRTHAELNLYKLRHCRNIAGQEQQLEPYQTTGTNSTFALPPTPYRYSTLIDRAKQLTQLAAQAEAAMLSALEKHDAEAYNLLKARQDVQLTNAQVQLQSLRVQEASDSGQLATLQQAKAQIQENHYQSLIDNGLSDYETAALGFQFAAVIHLHTAAALKEAETFGIGGIGDVGNALAATASLLQTQASYERRNQEWEFQRDLAKKDVSIAAQQGTIAQDNVQIANQEQTIAAIQADHAAAIVDFLANKFTNAELYEWMSTILQRVYSFFLQQATVMAQLAANQLAFERQQVPPPYIQADYWEAPTESGAGTNPTNGNAPDRRGLTGSARLLQDIYQLDQYAFLTNTRKLQLTKTISLAQLAPAEFQNFLETGVLTFATPMAMFDSEFPGHYLRLIKRVRISVIALIPPALGIRATLSTTGTSRVDIPGNSFQSVVVRREPMSVALSSPSNATGLFVDLDPQPDMLLPFEDSGVDTNWELRMPRAANQFDFRTIADVLITIDYTALDSPDYRQQIVQKLNAKPFFSADRPFSFRNDLADQWYDLHNPEQTTNPMVVSFTTQRDDFPPNITDLKIQQVVLYFARAEGYPFEVPVTYLYFTEQGSTNPLGGPARSVDGIISTRTGSAGSWISMLGKSPIGQWDLAFLDTFPNGQQPSDVFKNEEIEDILFVITFSGRTPEWPV
jgi:Tc toxin complex TcA C-terminal TcB-binding domain/Repeat of unknown function (DUF346)